MAKGKSKYGKKRSGRTRKMRGGGWGFTGSASFPGQAGTVSNPMVYTGIGDCRAVKPGYDIPYSQYGASLKGLPGMSGGARRMNKSRKMRRQRTKKHNQRGGRYGFFPESAGTVTPNGGAWWAATYGPVQRIGCEGGSPNPLNPVHTGSSAPPGAVNPNYYLGKQMGGAQQMAPASVGVGDVDSMYYYAPTAGYANTASTWRDSVGAPVQIQVPFAARAMNQACLTTGGSPPLTGALQKGGKRSRKQRGGVWPFNTVVEAVKGAAGTVRGYLPGAAAPAAEAAPAANGTMPPPTARNEFRKKYGRRGSIPSGETPEQKQVREGLENRAYGPPRPALPHYIREKEFGGIEIQRKDGTYELVTAPDYQAGKYRGSDYYGDVPTDLAAWYSLSRSSYGGRRHKKSKSRKHSNSHKGHKGRKH